MLVESVRTSVESHEVQIFAAHLEGVKAPTEDTAMAAFDRRDMLLAACTEDQAMNLAMACRALLRSTE